MYFIAVFVCIVVYVYQHSLSHTLPLSQSTDEMWKEELSKADPKSDDGWYGKGVKYWYASTHTYARTRAHTRTHTHVHTQATLRVMTVSMAKMSNTGMHLHARTRAHTRTHTSSNHESDDGWYGKGVKYWYASTHTYARTRAHTHAHTLQRTATH